MEILDSLNDSQRIAVTYNDGPLLVIAGAGSGKTRVLTYKIAYLISQGVRAENILALTFTNKAAREMKERITRLVPSEAAHYLWMGTFHSICAKILRREADKLGFTRDFTIYDTTDSKSLLKQIIKEKQLDDKVYKVPMVLGKISDAKNRLLSPHAYALNADIQKQNRFDRLYEMADVYQTYQLRLQQSNAMDFDDLLMNTCKLLQNDSAALREYQDIFQYLLVDEYQDTNYAQYLIVKLLGEPQNHVCVVGDDAQSIYSFRGADIRNILSFQQGYPNAKLFKLERNYRSTQTIVKAANSLIHHNENQIYKEVYSEKEEGAPLQLYTYMTDREEGEGIVGKIKEEHQLRKVNLNDIAILYRTNAQSRSFENELRKANLPYRIYGGTSFYQRKEIKDAIGYFRLVINPKDNEALMRVINFPARGIGDTTLKRISEVAIENDVSMMDVVCHCDEYGLQVNSGIKNKLVHFSELMDTLGQAVEEQDAYQFADTMLHQTGIMAAAALDQTPEGIDRKQNLDELLSGIHEFVNQRTEEGISFTPIQDFLAEVSLLTDQDENLTDHTPRITLMTVHAAKGLEFRVVFIVGMEENLFPSQFCTAPREIEEERRLLYVAITRAMERCYLSQAKQRWRNGSVNLASPSRFLRDIDSQYIQKMVNSASSYSSRNMFAGLSWSSTPSYSTSARKPNPTTAVRGQVATNVTEFVKGDRVQHRVFGTGTVTDVYRENDNDKIEILFDTQGKKTLLLTYAKLEKI